MKAPLILTVQLDEQSQQFFNKQREHYFPPERNFLQAHLTLFHHLPNEATVVNIIRESALHQQQMTLSITEVVSIGKGVAYKISSRDLVTFHKKLQLHWRTLLTPQDAQGLWPHITIQNKVTAIVAKRTKEELQSTFVPFNVIATGLQLWEYLNGPWRLYRKFAFVD